MADDFYIESECCLACGVPEDIAPELFGMGEHVCFMRRQPVSQAEIDKMILAMQTAEVDCIRYRGGDIRFLQRLGEADLAFLADDQRAGSFPALIRDRVVFSLPVRCSLDASPRLWADMFREYLRGKDGYTVLRPLLRPARVKFAWYKRHFHSVGFRYLPDSRAVAVLYPGTPTALQGLARGVDEWLRKGFGASGIAWHTKIGLAVGQEGYPRPY